MDRQVRLTGEVPNLRMLLDDLNRVPEFRRAWTASIERAMSDGSKMGSADLATLIIDLGVGVVSSGMYDVIKAAVAAARRRGAVTAEGLEQAEEEVEGRAKQTDLDG